MNLSNEKLIKYNSFHIKVIYVLPCISLNESKRVEELEKDVENLRKEVKELKEMLSKKK